MIEQFKARAGEVTAGFTAVQKVTMGAVFAVVLGALWFFSSWASTTDMAPLYADLETSDAAAIVDELDSMGVPYELADRGRTILVPRDQVYDLRLDLSTEGLPNGGAEGYSLLDNQGITSTQFQQRIAFQRALEGELAATIRSIESVNAASVHLVIPQDDLFAADDIHATASVLVETDSTLAAEQVQAIVNLVAGSVEGLRADAVTVADQSGLVLAAPGQTPFERVGAGGATSQTRAFEQELAAQIQTMLTAVVGPGNVMATVSAEMDWDASSTVSEVHTPVVGEDDAQLANSERLANESYTTNQGGGDGGILGGGEDGTAATSESTFNSSDIERDYLVDSFITTTESAGGDIQRLNVAVLLDETSSTADQLAEIEALVATATGIDPERGDTLAVSRLTFDPTIEEALAVNIEELGSGAEAASAGGMVRTIVLGVLGLLIVAVAGVQLWRGRRATEEIEELDLVTLTNSLSAGASRPVMAASTGPGAGPISRSGPEAQNLTPEEELRALVDQQPDEVARLLRTWLADRRAVAR